MLSTSDALRLMEKDRLEKNLKEENFWMYVNVKTKEVSFSNDYEKKEGSIGYFVIDSSRIENILKLKR